MTPWPWKTISACFDGSTLAVAGVSGSALGASAKRVAECPDFLDAAPEQRRQSLRDAPRSGRLVLTVPASWCSVRPMPLTTDRWPRARDEITRSITNFLPLTPDDALLGVLDRITDDAAAEEGPGGYLVGCSRSQVDGLRVAVEQALGRQVDIVLTPHMALLGLGHQHVPAAAALEPSPTGWTRHELRYGRIARLDRRSDDDAAGPVDVLPGPGSEAAPSQARLVSTYDLAVAAALALSVRSRDFIPLIGRTPSASLAWAAPAAMIALAAGVLWGAYAVSVQRYEQAAAQLKTEQAAVEPATETLAAQRESARRLVQAIDKGVNELTADWKPILPVLYAAQSTVPKDGFIYTVDVRPDAVQISGETPRAGDVLGALERDPRFTDARYLRTIAPVAGRELEQFEVQATRTDAAEDDS